MNMLAPDRRQYDPANPLTMGMPAWADAWDANPAQAAQDLVNAQLAAQQQQPVAAPQQPPDATVAPGDGGIATVDVTAKAPTGSAPHPDHPDPLWADNPAQWRQLFSSDPAESDAAWKTFLSPAPATTYAGMLPVARDEATGALRPALPSGVRQLVQGAYDLVRGPETGTVTPEATMALAMPGLGRMLERPDENILSAFSGSQRAIREAEAAAAAAKGEAAPTNLLGQVIARTEGAAPAEGAAVAPATPAAPANVLQQAVAKTEADAAAAAQPLADAPMLKQIVTDGIRDEDRVSTRIPTAAPPKTGPAPPDPHRTSDLNIGITAARDSQPAFDKNAMTLRDGDYPDLPVKGMRNPANIADVSVQHMANNLVWLHDQMAEKYGQGTVDRAANWYDGAHQIALRLAEKTGYEPRQIAAVMAALSPQKDWYQNADLGDRLVDIVQNAKQQPWTPEMTDWATKYAAEKAADIAKDRGKGKGDRADTKQVGLDTFNTAVGRLQNAPEPTLGGVPLWQINDPDARKQTAYERALFVRAYDEAHHSKDYPIVTPEGNFGPTATNDDGTPSKVAWGSFPEITKALSALDSPDKEKISKLMGGNHKVRSFYNNIISPNSQYDDTTIDTHAINATHLRPMGGSHAVVKMGLGMGGSSSNATGSQGAYGLEHEAYRQATAALNARPGARQLLPRQLQSIAWEAVRGLFTPEQKRDTALVADVNDIWKQARDRKISIDEARNQILARVKGIDPPSWYKKPVTDEPDEEPQQ